MKIRIQNSPKMNTGNEKQERESIENLITRLMPLMHLHVETYPL